MDYQEALDEFLLEKEIDTAPATQTFYRDNLTAFQEGSGIVHLEDFTPKTITTYVHSKKHLAPASIESIRRALSVFSNWLYRRRYIEENPFHVLPKPKRVINHRPSYFTKPQVQAIYSEARRSQNSKRDKALFLLLLDTGIRIGEAANLEVQDIDWRNKSIHVNGKTGPRDVPISTKTAYALRTYINQHRRARPREHHVFLTRAGKPQSGMHLSGHLRRLAQRAGIKGPKLGAHTYRHTFAVHYLKNGGDAFSLQRILGHTTMLMTSVYTRMTNDDLKSLHELHSPTKHLL